MSTVGSSWPRPMLHYAREDVRHTAMLYANCLAELRRHQGVDLAPDALYSPAGVGAAYLRAMNVTPPLAKFADLDPHLLGWSMGAFYGGRAEARIVRTPVPVVVADFTSMYPVSYTHLRAHETPEHLVCRLLLE